MATPVLTRTVSGPTVSGTKFPPISKPFGGNRDDSFVGTIAAGATDVHYVVTFPYATLQLLMIQARGGNLLLETNAADATGGDAINLVDSEPTYYGVNGPVANPLTHNVTAMYFTNAGAVPVDFEIIALNQVASS